MVNNCYQQTDNVDLNLLHKYICLNKDNKLFYKEKILSS